MRRILVTTDFSSRSERALRRAGLLAKQFSAELTVSHVVEEDQPEVRISSEMRSAEEFLTELTRSLPELRDQDYRILVIAGDAFDGILRAAEISSADLIVMGAHRKQLLRDVFIGTTIERVIRIGSRPVLVVNRDAARSYRRAVAAVDLSDASAHALQSCKTLGLLDGVDVSLVHALHCRRKVHLVCGRRQAKRDR